MKSSLANQQELILTGKKPALSTALEADSLTDLLSRLSFGFESVVNQSAQDGDNSECDDSQSSCHVHICKKLFFIGFYSNNHEHNANNSRKDNSEKQPLIKIVSDHDASPIFEKNKAMDKKMMATITPDAEARSLQPKLTEEGSTWFTVAAKNNPFAISLKKLVRVADWDRDKGSILQMNYNFRSNSLSIL